VSGKKFKIYESPDSGSEASDRTAATLTKKRGRPAKSKASKVSFPKTDKRKAKTNASSVIKQLYKV